MKNNIKERNIVEALIVNQNGDFLLQKKTLDYPKGPGQWTFFGGEIKYHEKPINSIKRELKEELGIKTENLKLYCEEDYKLEDKFGKKYFGRKYVFLVNFNYKISKISLSEGAGFAFFNPSELSSIDTHPMCRKTLEEYFTPRK